jgi:hypothetical protein
MLAVYYRVYAEDGAIPSRNSATADDPFLGRIKANSIAPPHTVTSLKRCLAKFEAINDDAIIGLFLTPSSQSPMNSAGKVSLSSGTGPGSIPQEPLALVAKISDSDQRDLESGQTGENTPENGATFPGTRYCTFLLSIAFIAFCVLDV